MKTCTHCTVTGYLTACDELSLLPLAMGLGAGWGASCQAVLAGSNLLCTHDSPGPFPTVSQSSLLTSVLLLIRCHQQMPVFLCLCILKKDSD